MTDKETIRVSRLPQWQQELLRREIGRKKLIPRALYEAVLNLNQIRYVDKKEKP